MVKSIALALVVFVLACVVTLFYYSHPGTAVSLNVVTSRPLHSAYFWMAEALTVGFVFWTKKNPKTFPKG